MAKSKEISERITARTREPEAGLVSQCDIFRDLEFVESVEEVADKLKVCKISFPYAICLNQSCDLLQDRNLRQNGKVGAASLLQFIMLPLFPLRQVQKGGHWGDVLQVPAMQDLTRISKNQDPRYHFIRFPDDSKLEPFIIDFKHFFTLSRDYVYKKIDNRVCSIASLYRDDISRRFANYISRIGLPEE